MRFIFWPFTLAKFDQIWTDSLNAKKVEIVIIMHDCECKCIYYDFIELNANTYACNFVEKLCLHIFLYKIRKKRINYGKKSKLNLSLCNSHTFIAVMSWI